MLLLTLEQTPQAWLAESFASKYWAYTGPQSRSSVCSGSASLLRNLCAPSPVTTPKSQAGQLQICSKTWVFLKFRLGWELPCLWGVAFKLSSHLLGITDMWGCDAGASCFSVGVLCHPTGTHCFRTFYSLTWLCSGHFIRWSVIKIQGMKIWWSL